MDFLALGIIIGLILGAALTYVAQFSISTGLLGRKQQAPSGNKPPAP